MEDVGRDNKKTIINGGGTCLGIKEWIKLFKCLIDINEELSIYNNKNKPNIIKQLFK